VIRDPVWGDVELPAQLLPVLDSPAVQRLRGIKQLGFAHLVYPGATHTRFDHSLGVVAAAQRVLAALGDPLAGTDRLAVIAAALVHDASHVPFGHTLEDEWGLFGRHDEPARLGAMLADGRLSAALERAGVAAAVGDLLTGSGDWRAQVIAGSVDADLLDYLRRDAYFCGLPHVYDQRVLHALVLAPGPSGPLLAVRLTDRGLDRPDVRSELVHLLRLRYLLTERVYTHHTKVAAGAMVARAVEAARAQGLAEADLAGWGDHPVQAVEVPVEAVYSIKPGAGSKEALA